MSPRPLSLNQSIDLGALMSQMSPDGRSPTLLRFTCISASQKKRVFAKPSIFALAISVHVRNEKSRCNKVTHNAFLYSRQMERVKERVQCPPLHHIIPFSFDTPSPDDIVKANQRKAFTRDWLEKHHFCTLTSPKLQNPKLSGYFAAEVNFMFYMPKPHFWP